MTQLAGTADTTITPALGEHFYYSKITLSTGQLLWTAPAWVTQEETGPVGASQNRRERVECKAPRAQEP